MFFSPGASLTPSLEALKGPAGDLGLMLVAGLFTSFLPPWIWKRDECTESEDRDKISVKLAAEAACMAFAYVEIAGVLNALAASMAASCLSPSFMPHFCIG